MTLRARLKRLRQKFKEAWRPPCIACGGDATLCPTCAKETNPRFFKLGEARLCLNLECEAVFGSSHSSCPACGDSQWRPVGFFYQDSPQGRKARSQMRLVKNGK